jgi:hypothetical protein
VSRVFYGRMLMGTRSRNVLVYLTTDGLVTDQDILSE